MNDLEISFPSPCREQWEGMEPQGCNRRCETCDTIVHDLAALALPEVETLLDSGRKVCVRARIKPDGAVLLADRGASQRRLKALVGASLGLAVAACQHGVTPLYDVSGKADAGARVVVQGNNGVSKVGYANSKGRFKVGNLPAGTYVLTTWVDCSGEKLTVEGIHVGPADVELGEIEGSGHVCIVVGMVERADNPTG